MNGGIYSITNTVNGAIYIGSTVDFKVRWSAHSLNLRKGIHKNIRLQEDWLLYGPDAFEFGIVEKVAARADLIPRENAHIFSKKAAESPNYNVAYKARRRAHGGKPLTAEARARMSASAKRRGTIPRTPESNAKLAVSQKLAWERRRTNGKHIVSDETREKLSLAGKGRKHTPEAIEKMRTIARKKGLSGPVLTEEAKARKAESLRRARLSHDSKWHDPDSKRRHSEALKTAWAKRRSLEAH